MRPKFYDGNTFTRIAIILLLASLVGACNLYRIKEKADSENSKALGLSVPRPLL